MSKKTQHKYTAAIRVGAIFEVPVQGSTIEEAAVNAMALKRHDVLNGGFDIADYDGEAVVEWITKAD